MTTNSETLAERARKVAGHGFKNLQAEEGRVRLNQDIFQDPDYKRHDTLGWNYRLSEFNAAIALAQLERVDELINLRIKSAELFIEVMKDCEYLITQFVPEGCVHTYYTLGVLYEGGPVSWKNFRAKYIENGGDGIYGCWSVPYQEPIMEKMKFKGNCHVAEAIQPKIMQFKTNYRDLELAGQKADALRKTIEGFK